MSSPPKTPAATTISPRMDKVRALHASVIKGVDSVHDQTARILAEQEKDLLRAFRSRLTTVQGDPNAEVDLSGLDGDITGEEAPFISVEQMPEFPGGGEGALIAYIAKNTKYPAMARENNIEGTVFISFVVEKDGSVSDVKILRGIGGGCDEEAKRVIKNLPNFAPGRQNGRPVRVQFNVPVKFKLM